MKTNRRNGKIKRETIKEKEIFSFMHSTITKWFMYLLNEFF